MQQVFSFICRQLLKELQDVLAQDSSPVMNYAPKPILEDKVQKSLNNFSSITHGFGNLAIRSFLNVLQVI